MRPLYIMLAGLPGSGKSTLANEIYRRFPELCFIFVDTDGYIEAIARQEGKTYNEVFDVTIGEATKFASEWRTGGLQAFRNIIHDQTNLTVKSRSRKLQDVPGNYIKIAVWCEVDEELRRQRIVNRPGKLIPPHVDGAMRNSIEHLSTDEGFDHVFLSYYPNLVDFLTEYSKSGKCFVDNQEDDDE